MQLFYDELKLSTAHSGRPGGDTRAPNYSQVRKSMLYDLCHSLCGSVSSSCPTTLDNHYDCREHCEAAYFLPVGWLVRAADIASLCHFVSLAG